ncbi:hypothetical protein [Myroides injenensis]|uniref:hypothetical protein n=1 Tax=Myroides injenensis TaxID=1183151 RepID=UPI0002892ACF|nr:hypothetical protein [Myroides injenensis]
MGRKQRYFRFWLNSGNEHSVHSPFVFNLLTKGLYPKNSQWKSRSKKEAFPYRVIQYYSPNAIFNSSTMNVDDYNANNNYDLIWIGADKKSNLTVEHILEKMHNDTIVMIDFTDKGVVNEDLWDAIVRNSNFTATLDFYYYGLAYIRNEQLKQHFILRM